MAADQQVGQKTTFGSDTHLSRAVVDARLATAQEVKACIAKLEQLRAAGTAITLGELMVRAGFVTQSQLKRLSNPSDDSVSGSLKQLPGFQILQKIGAGAMASVYKARQVSLDRIVAIKVLPRRLSEDPEFVARFYKEGQAAARLNHNNIVQAIDVSEFGGSHYFVMEFVDGNTVHERLAENKPYSEKEALAIIIQIARALEHAHSRGFIHRDVKPKNIMITRDGTAKLADMGLAREASDVAAAEAEKGRAYGTPYYISPEQIRGLKDVDFRADIYSLGATLYHMVTGRVPFEGPTPAAIMLKHMREPLVPPDHLNSSLSTGLAEVVERAMAKDRNQRYASTSDLLADLERVAHGEAPLQARTGFKQELLTDLAESGDSQPAFAAEGAGDRVATRRARVFPMLVAGLILEAVAILVLLIVLAVR